MDGVWYTGDGLVAIGSSEEPPALHVAAWQVQPAAATGHITWQRSTELLTRLLERDPPHAPQQAGTATPSDPMDLDAALPGSGTTVLGSEIGKLGHEGAPQAADRLVRVCLSSDGSTCAVAWEGHTATGGPGRQSHVCLLAPSSMKVRILAPSFQHVLA